MSFLDPASVEPLPEFDHPTRGFDSCAVHARSVSVFKSDVAFSFLVFGVQERAGASRLPRSRDPAAIVFVPDEGEHHCRSAMRVIRCSFRGAEPGNPPVEPRADPEARPPTSGTRRPVSDPGD